MIHRGVQLHKSGRLQNFGLLRDTVRKHTGQAGRLGLDPHQPQPLIPGRQDQDIHRLIIPVDIQTRIQQFYVIGKSQLMHLLLYFGQQFSFPDRQKHRLRMPLYDSLEDIDQKKRILLAAVPADKTHHQSAFQTQFLPQFFSRRLIKRKPVQFNRAAKNMHIGVFSKQPPSGMLRAGAHLRGIDPREGTQRIFDHVPQMFSGTRCGMRIRDPVWHSRFFGRIQGKHT